MALSERHLGRALIALGLIMVSLKLYLAGTLDLFGDEAFYRQCARRPDWAYMDLPGLTAALVRLGTALCGDSLWSTRLPFLVLGALFPPLVYALALAYVPRVQALLAALLALALPAYAWLGLTALPDVPLLLFATAMLLCFERATRAGSLRWWAATGLCCCLGFATHYRFVLAPAAGLLYLLIHRDHWRWLKTPGPWLCGVIAALGLLPGLAYNLQHDFAPLRYFLVVRNQEAYRPGLIATFLLKQAALVSPLAFAFLIAGAAVLWRRMRSGQSRLLLPLLHAGLPVLVFLAMSPRHHTGVQSMHWLLSAYPALLVFATEPLVAWYRAGRWRRWLAVAAPLSALLLALLALVGLALPLPATVALRHPFLGWRELSARTQQHLARFEKPPLLVADHYKSGANLEFYLGGRQVFVMAHSKNFEHGRQNQFDLWSIGEAELRRHERQEALLVVETSEIPKGFEAVWWQHLAYYFEPMELLEEWTYQVPGARGDGRRQTRVFRFYRCRVHYTG